MKYRKWLGSVAVILSVGVLGGVVYGANTKNVATEEKQPIEDSEQMYGIGSVSKMFGAVSVMRLVQEGKVDLDAPLTTYIPEFEMADVRYKKITPRMLLNHTSGLLGSSHHDNLLFGEASVNYKDHVLESLKTQRLKADPGEFSVYCNDGFTLAEILVERVSGMSFTEFVAKYISQPLGMENTKTPKDDFDSSLLAKTYINGMETPIEKLGSIASGGIYGTAQDLCRFSTVFMKDYGSILNPEYVEEMGKQASLADQIGVQQGDSNLGYGLGWDSVNLYPFNQYGMKALSKGGDTTVYHANLTVLPEQNMSVAVTSSGGASAYCEIAAQEILLEVLKEEGLIDEIKEEAVECKKEKVAIPDSLKKYAGFYQSKSMLKVEFTKEDTMALTAIDAKYPMRQEYIYTAEGEFVSTNGKYISTLGQLVGGENGTRGNTALQFKEETNGEVYMVGTTYESLSGMGKVATTMPMAQKVEAHQLDADTAKAWAAREGKKYYIVSENYASAQNISEPYVAISQLLEVPGYTRSNEMFYNTKIIDANTAICDMQLPGMIGRDLKDYQFYNKNGVEYLKINDLLFKSEDGISSSQDLEGQCIIGQDGEAQWYQVQQEDVGKEITIEVPQQSAYYVYDEEGKLIRSSLFGEVRSSVILPEGGMIALIGNKGATFTVKVAQK